MKIFKMAMMALVMVMVFTTNCRALPPHKYGVHRPHKHMEETQSPPAMPITAKGVLAAAAVGIACIGVVIVRKKMKMKKR